MKVIPHSLHCTGFFDEFDIEILASQLQNVISRKDDYFSIGTHPNCKSVIECNWRLNTENEAVVEESDESVVPVLIHELRERAWIHVKIEIRHGLRIRPSGLPYFGSQNEEFFSLIVDREEGHCEVSCRLRERTLTEAWMNEVVRGLKLSFKPKKHSRDIPEWLETKLLCDSMHSCNVCRQEGVIIHHIEAVDDGGRTEDGNLIVLCLTHHRQAHTKSLLSKNLRPEHLREYKARHAKWVEGRGDIATVRDLTETKIKIVEGAN